MKPHANCARCPLLNAPGPVWGTGPASAKLIGIGMAPASEEIREDTPFVGSAGVTLGVALREAGLDRSEVFLTNVVKCFVAPGHKLPLEAVRCCAPLLQKELDALPEAKTYLTFGADPFYALTKKSLHIQASGSKKKKSNKSAVRTDSNYWLRGAPYVISHLERIAIIPTLHPAYLNYTAHMDRFLFKADLQKAIRFSKGEGIFIEPHWNYHPTDQEVREYVLECQHNKSVGLDIETPEKAVYDEEELIGSGAGNIDIIGISCNLGEAVGVQPDQFRLLEPLLEDSSVWLFVFNALFDIYHIKAKRGPVKAFIFDVMLALHELHSDFKAKNLATALSLYTDMPYHKNLAKSQPDFYNAADTYGVLWAGQSMIKEMQRLQVYEHFLNFTTAMLPVCESLRVNGPKADTHKADKFKLLCYKALEQYEGWWAQNIKFCSFTQNKELMKLFAHQGLPIRYRMRKDKATNSRKKTPTCDEKVLIEYRDKFNNQVAGLTLLMRKLKKAADFCDIYQSDGVIHATYGIHFQDQGRIQTRNPDLQNIPDHLVAMGRAEDGSEKYLVHPREIVIGDTSEYDIIVADYAQIEFRLYAKLANEVELLKEIEKGTYIYGLAYEKIYKRPFFDGVPPGGVKSKQYKAKWVTSKELLVAKTAPMGWVYGRQDYTETGMSKSESEAFGRLMHSSFPAISEFQRKLDFLARKQGYLRNPFNRIRPVANATLMRNKYLSFMGQGTCVDIVMRNALIPLFSQLPEFGARLIFTVYDSIGICSPKRHTPEVVSLVRSSMEQPLDLTVGGVLDGYSIPCDVKVGASWGTGRVVERDTPLSTVSY